MQQMWRHILTGIFLISGSWQDIRKKQLSVKWLIYFGITALIVDIFYKIPFPMCISGMIPGVMLLLIGAASKEAVGYGDGFSVMVLGLFLFLRDTIWVLSAGFFISTVVSIVILSSGRRKRVQTVPFLPFLTAGFAWYLLCLEK